MATELKFAAAGALLAAFSVMAGAFGAHFLQNRIDSGLLEVFETGARYQMYHALALFAAAAAYSRRPGAAVRLAGRLFVAGTAIFSGSLYALALTGMRWWGAVTPLGGTALILGWLLLFWGIVKAK